MQTITSLIRQEVTVVSLAVVHVCLTQLDFVVCDTGDANSPISIGVISGQLSDCAVLSRIVLDDAIIILCHIQRNLVADFESTCQSTTQISIFCTLILFVGIIIQRPTAHFRCTLVHKDFVSFVPDIGESVAIITSNVHGTGLHLFIAFNALNIIQ